MKLRRVVRLFVLSLGLPALVLLPGQVARAQRPAPTITINQTDASAYPKVRSVVTVLDERGVPIEGLVPAQFQAFDGDAQLEIASVQAAKSRQLPLSVVVAIDVSDSMLGDRIEKAKQAATTFVRALEANDQVSVVAFGDRVTRVVALTNDRVALTNGIAGLQAGGGTALYEAAVTSAFAAAATKGDRIAVVVLTDGKNESGDSRATREESLRIVRGAGVPVFTIGVGAMTDEGYLRELADSTRGRYALATPDSVNQVYQSIATQLRSQYVVTVRDAAPADGEQATLQIVALVGNTSVGATATYVRVAPVAGVPTAAGPSRASTKTSSPSSRMVAYAFAVGAVLLVVLAFAYLRWRRGRRLLRAQLQIVAPNVRRAAAQPLPAWPVGYSGGGAATAVAAEVGTGTLSEKGGEDRVFHIGAGPVIIGSSSRLCSIVLPGEAVAPEHARIWLRDGRYMLHHIGGPSRKTRVAGREADWVVLESGDEVQVGPWRLVFEA